MKKLYRSKKDRSLLGLFSGLGHYFDIDPTVLRLVWVLIAVMTGFIPGLLAYIIAALFVPEEPSDSIIEETKPE